MSWANPTALWLLAALLLLVFARRRKPLRRVAVSNLYLWTAATTRDVPSLTRRFRRSVLVLLQAAFMAAVIGAIARPLLSFGSGHVAFIVDVSMSMGARHVSATRLDAAKAHVAQLMQALPRASRVRLWTAGATADDRGEFASRDSALTSAVQALQTTDTAADLESAVARARHSDPPPSRIYVVTDAPDGAPVDDVHWTRIAEPGENVALTRLAARRRAADRSIAVLLAATNYGARTASVAAVISQNDSILARRAMQLPPGGEGSAVMTIPPTTGIVFARLDADDALAADDSRAVAIPPADPLRVRLINGSHFVEQALTTHPGTLVHSTPDGRGANADYDVIVCDGCDAVPANTGSAGVLVLPPRSVAAREAAPVAVSVNARAHPLVGLLNLDGMLIAPIESGPSRSADGSRPTAASIDDPRVIAHAAGVPVIVAQDDGLRRVAELRFDPAAGFALESAFPMLIANCLNWLAAPSQGAVTLTAGDLLQLRPAAAPSEPAQTKVIIPVITGPDGRAVPTSERAGTFIAQTERAGVYRVTQGAETETIVVNAHVEGESDLSATAAPGRSSAAVAPPSTGWDGAGLLLVLALALLALEWRLKNDDRGLTT